MQTEVERNVTFGNNTASGCGALLFLLLSAIISIKKNADIYFSLMWFGFMK